MRDFWSLFLCSGVGIILGASTVFMALSDGKEDCEKDLPRAQECTLQWVKPEASK